MDGEQNHPLILPPSLSPVRLNIRSPTEHEPKHVGFSWKIIGHWMRVIGVDKNTEYTKAQFVIIHHFIQYFITTALERLVEGSQYMRLEDREYERNYLYVAFILHLNVGLYVPVIRVSPTGTKQKGTLLVLSKDLVMSDESVVRVSLKFNRKTRVEVWWSICPLTYRARRYKDNLLFVLWEPNYAASHDIQY